VGASELGVGYRLYLANNQIEGAERSDRRDAKSWGGRVQLRLPGIGVLRRLDIAADIYRGHVAVTEEGLLAEDRVYGFETQLEVDRFMLYGEYAQGKSLDIKRLGYYLQPAVRLHEDWLTFYRAERVDSPLLGRAETRHLAGVNFRPTAQIALKLEYYRALPRARFFVPETERDPYNGMATSAVFFF